MSTGAIIAIVAGAIGLLAVIVLLTQLARNRRLEQQRARAGELRDGARSAERGAQEARAGAAEQAARAQRLRAEADEKAAIAHRNEIAAGEHADEAERRAQAARLEHDRARAADPDMSDSGQEEAIALDREGERQAR